LQKKGPTMALASLYDSVFEKYRNNIPLNFLKALATKASGLNTNKSTNYGAGLFMISNAVLDAFNSKMKTTYKATDLVDPSVNTQMAVYVINNIVGYYAANYPKTMIENWNNPEYVALVVHGYNNGYKEPKGVGAAIKAVENAAPGKMSLDTVAQAAKTLSLSPEMYSAGGLAFAKNVASLTVASPKPATSAAVLPAPSATGGKGGGVGGLGVALFIGAPLALFALLKGRGK
jgi:hypothetical protein